MPGNIAVPTPTLVMPQQLCTAFSESREYAQLANQYHDGTPQMSQLAQTSRRTFKLTRRLNALQLAALRNFFVSVNGGLTPFIFYNPYEGSPVGSNYDSTGAGTVGRVIVVFRSSWTQTTGLSRTDISELQLVELGVGGGGTSPTTFSVTVASESMPWRVTGSLNTAYPYGQQDGIGPVVISTAAGATVTLQYVSGSVVGGIGTAHDANGTFVTGTTSNSYGTFPTLYMPGSTLGYCGLCGAFTDSFGSVVQPLSIGNSATFTVPAGATQLQLAINDNKYNDNTGSFVISVSLS